MEYPALRCKAIQNFQGRHKPQHSDFNRPLGPMNRAPVLAPFLQESLELHKYIALTIAIGGLSITKAAQVVSWRFRYQGALKQS